MFDGRYNDPNHPGCLRSITSVGKKITITGRFMPSLQSLRSYSFSDDPNTKTTWTISAVEETPGKVLVDFSPKGGPTDLLGRLFEYVF